MSDTSPTSANAITVRTGNQEIRVPAGLSVAQIREQLNKIGANNPNAIAYSGSQSLSESDTPAGGSTIQFITKMGEKG